MVYDLENDEEESIQDKVIFYVTLSVLAVLVTLYIIAVQSM